MHLRFVLEVELHQRGVFFLLSNRNLQCVHCLLRSPFHRFHQGTNILNLLAFRSFSFAFPPLLFQFHHQCHVLHPRFSSHSLIRPTAQHSFSFLFYNGETGIGKRNHFRMFQAKQIVQKLSGFVLLFHVKHSIIEKLIGKFSTRKKIPASSSRKIKFCEEL